MSEEFRKLFVTVDDAVELAKMIRKTLENSEIKSNFHKENLRVLKTKFNINDSNQKLTLELDALIKASSQRT
jgi:hypothetical protein